MIIICKGQEGEYVFTENPNDLEILVDLSQLEEYLENGKKDELQRLFETVMQTEQYLTAEKSTKDQIEWAQQTTKDYGVQNVVDNEEIIDENEGYDLLNPDPNSRYPDVHLTNKFLEENIFKIKARVQLLQQTEQRNLVKAKSVEQSAQKLYQIKVNRFQKEEFRTKFQKMQQLKIEQKQREIYEQKCYHQRILAQSKGKQGKIVQERISKTREMKQRIQEDYTSTKRAVQSENQKSYERIKKMEIEHQEKLQKFFFDKQIFAQQNYQRKVDQEFQVQLRKQDELEILEKQESNLLERIKVTQQIYQNSTAKLEQIKTKSYKELTHI